MSFLEDRKQIEVVAERARELMFSDNEPISLSDFCNAIGRIGGRCTSVETLEYGEAKIVPVETEEACFELQYPAKLQESSALFALVREFGYLLLHEMNPREYGLKSIQFGRSANSPMHERRASEFAAVFLMPEKLFREIANRMQITDVMQTKEMEAIADYFQVSVQAAMMRGVALKIW